MPTPIATRYIAAGPEPIDSHAHARRGGGSNIYGPAQGPTRGGKHTRRQVFAFPGINGFMGTLAGARSRPAASLVVARPGPALAPGLAGAWSRPVLDLAA